jgi:hypothetical protein
MLGREAQHEVQTQCEAQLMTSLSNASKWYKTAEPGGKPRHRALVLVSEVPIGLLSTTEDI